MRGRPRCSSICCLRPDLLAQAYEGGKTSQDLAKEIGVSDEHILQVLRGRVEVRKKGARKGVPFKRTHPINRISDEELFTLPTKEVALKYGLSLVSGTVSRLRRKRREGGGDE